MSLSGGSMRRRSRSLSCVDAVIVPSDGRRVAMLNDDRIRVLIAHSNPLVAAGLEAACSTQQDFYIVRCRDSVEASLVDAVTVAVMDFEGGTQRLAAQWGGVCRVLILSDDDSEVSIRRAMQLGVGGYLPLSSGLGSAVSAVRCIHSGGKAIAPNA